MNPMLKVTPEQYTEKLNFSDALGFGAEMLLIGVLAVFAVLGIIWATLTVFKFVFNKENTATKVEAKPAVQPSVSAPVYTANDTEIVAVIAAAIAMAEAECDDGTKFRVVSFRRKQR